MFGTYVRNYKGKVIVPYGDCTGDHLSSSVMPKFGTNCVGRETSKRRRPWRELERERGRERAKAHHREGHVIKLGLTCEGVWESEKIPKEKCLFFVYVVRAGFS